MTVNIKNDQFFIKLVEKGLLAVSKRGRVKNTKTGNYIGYTNKHGYIAIGYKYKGRTKHILVHRLVYIIYKYKMQPLPFIVNHRDGVKDNNYYKNLERSNYSHNTKHAYSLGLANVSEQAITRFKSYVGEKNPVAVFSNKKANKIRKLYNAGGFSQRALARKFGVHHSQIGRIVRNETYCE